MSELNQEIMKQLLADQARSLLRKLKNLVKVEVANQIETHVNQLAQLHNEQLLLKKKVNELTSKMSVNQSPLPPTSCVWPSSTLPSSPTALLSAVLPIHTTDTPSTPTLPHQDTIEAAKHTLTFLPAFHDGLAKTQLDLGVIANTETVLRRANGGHMQLGSTVQFYSCNLLQLLQIIF